MQIAPLVIISFCIIFTAQIHKGNAFALNGRATPKNLQIGQAFTLSPFSLVTPYPEPTSREIEEEEEIEESPNLTSLPKSIRFSCRNRIPGFYADPQAGCQVYHQCLLDGRRFTFLCGRGTIFNQKNFICDHWYNYDCNDALIDAEENARVFFVTDELPPENLLS